MMMNPQFNNNDEEKNEKIEKMMVSVALLRPPLR